MKHVLLFIIFTVVTAAGEVIAAPEKIGPLYLGMPMGEYIKETGLKLIDCETHRLSSGKKIYKAEIVDLTLDRKSLCSNSDFDTVGVIEANEVGGVKYKLIHSGYKVGGFLESIGHSSKAIFMNDNLVSLEIYAPEVDAGTLAAKYGKPDYVDSREVTLCVNSFGTEFEDKNGKEELIWESDRARSTFRRVTMFQHDSCRLNRGFVDFYIIELRSEIELLDAAILRFHKSIQAREIAESPF
ncbi:hypothetical protein [Microbulbifer hydrolyticus]|uniref:Uncharacterized protein n=1 Tax=Microbulbifer hydrolyticus TaxID=48074 RepID=A0A6P1TB42_9GAMM|nr:hypothetical protein [Microbulbifer hydrolyticus]MBB5210528.1 hypothetical protein [Microbulbifer hydrolyticus]QHQ39001.1 hypothetical protein GTQ55_08385 [Microbulbifer hydrolyticus]